MAEWTPEMEAELAASIGGAVRQQAPPPPGTYIPEQEPGVADEGGAPTEPREPQTLEELREALKGMNRRLGERDHEIGQLRKMVQEKGESTQPPDPAQLEQQDQQRFDRVMRLVDPRWNENKADSAYVEAMQTQYRMQKLIMAAVNDAIGEIRQERVRETEESRLQASGFTPEIQAQIAADPGLSGLWQAADFNGRLRLLQLVGAGGAGKPPAVGGTRQAPRRIDASLAIERPGISGVPLGTAASPELDRDTVAGMMRDPQDKKRLEYMLDEFLDQQNQAAPGYKLNPAVRGR